MSWVIIMKHRYMLFLENYKEDMIKYIYKHYPIFYKPSN